MAYRAFFTYCTNATTIIKRQQQQQQMKEGARCNVVLQAWPPYDCPQWWEQNRTPLRIDDCDNNVNPIY